MAEQAKVNERSIPLYIILTLLTCGLFSIYWFIVLAGDIWYCYYTYPNYIEEIQEERGLKVNDVSLAALLLGIFGLGIISLALIQNELNKIDAARQ